MNILYMALIGVIVGVMIWDYRYSRKSGQSYIGGSKVQGPHRNK